MFSTKLTFFMPIFRLAEFNFKTKFYNNLFGSTGDQSDTASFLEMDDYGSSGSQMGGFDAAGGASGNSDAEMQKFLMMEQQRAEFQGQVNSLPAITIKIFVLTTTMKIIRYIV